jgi:hypothetical protein
MAAPADAPASVAEHLGNAIAVYVRHGVEETAARQEEHEIPPLPPSLSFREHYLPLVTAMKTLHSELSTLFIVTNDPAVVDEASQLTDWTVIVHQEPRHPMSSKQAVEAGVSTPLVEAHKTVLSLMWSVQAKHFVCPLEAHFCRVLNDLRLTGDRRSAQFVTPVPRKGVDVVDAAKAASALEHYF